MKLPKHGAHWWALAALIAALGVLIYYPVRHFEFLNLDDELFVRDNPWLAMGLRWESVQWAFLANLVTHSTSAEYWSPLTLLSRLLEAHFFGINAGAFHIVSALLHLVNAGLLAVACWRLTGHWAKSAAVSVLFLVHPQNMEPVCWLSARKDLLSATFFFATLLAYAHYTRKNTRGRYALVLLAFGACLMAKPMGITIPLVLLLLDFWPLQRWRSGADAGRENVRLIAEKVPLLIVATLAAGLAVVSQQDWRALDADTKFPLAIRVGNAALSYTTYLRRLFWPSDLAVYYPHPGESLPWNWAIASAVLLTVLTVMAWWGRRRVPQFFTGWFWFGLVLGPVIGLVQIGGQAMADRYAYPALVGLLMALVWCATTWLGARFATVLGAMAAGVLTLVSMQQVQTWRNSETAFVHTIQVTGPNSLAHLNLGCALQDRGDLAGAREEFLRSVRLSPQSALAWNNLAQAENLLGNEPRAVLAYEAALERDPNQQQSLLFLARIMKKHQRWATARIHLEHLREVAPNLPQPYLELGEIFAAQQKWPEARAQWEEYMRRRPDDAAVKQKLQALP